MDVIDVQALPIERWLSVIEPEYFADYLPAGGAAAKFVIADDAAVGRLRHAAEALAQRHGMLPVHISAGEVRLHMLQDVFFALARALPWDDAAAALYRGPVHPQRLPLAAPRRRPDHARTGPGIRHRRHAAGAATATSGSAAICGTTPTWRRISAPPCCACAWRGWSRRPTRWTRRCCNGCAGKRSACRCCASTTSPRASTAPTRAPC